MAAKKDISGCNTFPGGPTKISWETFIVQQNKRNKKGPKQNFDSVNRLAVIAFIVILKRYEAIRTFG